MVESYRINAVLNFTSNGPQVLSKIGAEFAAFQKTIDAANNRIKGFERVLSGVGGRGVTKLVSDMERLGRIKVPNLEGLSALGKIGTVDAAGVGKLVTALTKLEKLNLSNVLRQLTEMEIALRGIVGQEERMLTIAKETSSAWQGTATAMKEGAAAMKAVPQPKSSGGGGSGGTSKHDIAMGGAIAGQAGSSVLKASESAWQAAADPAELLAQLKAMGFTKAQQEQAAMVARVIQQTVPTATYAGGLEAMKEAQSIFHDPDESIKAAPALVHTAATLQATTHGGDAYKLMYDAIKAGELAGALNKPGSEDIDLGRLNHFLSFVERISTSTGDKGVGPAQLLQFYKQGGSAAANLTESGVADIVPMIIELGGMRAGTAIQSLSQSLYGNMQASKAAEMGRLGLIDPTHITKNKGGTVSVSNGGIIGEKLLGENLPRYATEILEPALRKAVDPKNKMNEADLLKAERVELYKNYGRNTITRILESLITNRAAIKRSEEELGPGGRADKRGDMLKSLTEDNPRAAEKTLVASYQAFLAAMADPSLGKANEMMDKIAKTLDMLSNIAIKNPTAALIIDGIAVSLGTILDVIGKFATALIAYKLVFGTAAKALPAAASAAGGGAATAGSSLLGPIVGGVGLGLAAGYASGLAHAPMVDDYGNVIGNWGGGGPVNNIGQPISAAPKAASANQPGSSAANPIFNMQLNQPSGRDIANGTTDFMGRHLSGPTASTTHFDQKATPSFSLYGTP